MNKALNLADFKQDSRAHEVRRNQFAIVNFVTNNWRYENGQQRLMKSLEEFADLRISIFYVRGEDQIGAPLHKDNPYAFKLYAIRKVRDLGFRYVLWLDASIVAVKPVMPIFDRIRSQGIFFEDSGWKVGQWANDRSLELMGVSREEAHDMTMFSSGFVGFDFHNIKSMSYFGLWWIYMNSGAFVGSWNDHRHDQTAGSVAANQLGLTADIAPCKEFFSYVGPNYEINPDSIFHLIGL